jgi:beta-phosphoglucomutase-like phosphatase (HAD superfamily)
MIDLAVFDMAGTTVTDKDFVAKAFQKAFYNHEVIISEAQVNPLMGYPKPIAIEMVLESAGVEFDEEKVQNIHEDFVREMIEFYEESPFVQPMEDAEDLFFTCRKKAYALPSIPVFQETLPK